MRNNTIRKRQNRFITHHEEVRGRFHDVPAVHLVDAVRCRNVFQYSWKAAKNNKGPWLEGKPSSMRSDSYACTHIASSEKFLLNPPRGFFAGFSLGGRPTMTDTTGVRESHVHSRCVLRFTTYTTWLSCYHAYRVYVMECLPKVPNCAVMNARTAPFLSVTTR